MKEVINRFGTGTLYDKNDLGRSIYCICTACMSIWSDFLSFANREIKKTEDRHFVSDKIISISTDPEKAKKFGETDTIVVLGCQVTDLAIYNDLKTAEELHNQYPNIPIYMGGCLAQRFDIELPSYLRRLDIVRDETQSIDIINGFIDYQKPFWNKDLKENDDEFATGNLFRHMYPLKIGVGCHGNCKYCTIRDTRGEAYETDANLQIQEFLDHANEGVVLISDCPTIDQIKDWCHIAVRYNKPISFRNVEPQNAVSCQDELLGLSTFGLLKIFHCPIQSIDACVLKAMNISIIDTLGCLNFLQKLRAHGTKVATNIIIDYIVDGKVVHNMDEDLLNTYFDYWSWNPYFDGKWDYQKAKERFEKYIK